MPHIVTTEVEHDATIEPIKKIVEEGRATVSFVSVDKETGSISVESVIKLLRKVTIQISGLFNLQRVN